MYSLRLGEAVFAIFGVGGADESGGASSSVRPCWPVRKWNLLACLRISHSIISLAVTEALAQDISILITETIVRTVEEEAVIIREE